jgi:enamine deaminase RidA (YjgF/YER057c/UK114 family)
MVSNAETRLAASGIELAPAPPPFGPYVPAVQMGNLLFPTGMVPRVGCEAESSPFGVLVESEVILEVSA